MSKPRRKRSVIAESFVTHSISFRTSAAWAALPDNARRVLDRLELEHMQHGGADNGNLPCTYVDFEKAGIRRGSVALAIRQCVALGFVEVTFQGGRSAGEFRKPSRYRLTHIYGCGNSPDPTNEWQSLKTDEEAAAALGEAEAVQSIAAEQARKTHFPRGQKRACTGVKNEPPKRGSLGSKTSLLSQAQKRASYLYSRVGDPSFPESAPEVLTVGIRTEQPDEGDEPERSKKFGPKIGGEPAWH